MLYRRFNFLGDSKIDGFFNKLLIALRCRKFTNSLWMPECRNLSKMKGELSQPASTGKSPGILRRPVVRILFFIYP